MRITFFVLYLFVSSLGSIAQTDSLDIFFNSPKNDTAKAAGLINYAYRLEAQGQIRAAVRVLMHCSKFPRKKDLSKFYIQSEKLRAFLLTKSNDHEAAALVAD